MIDRIRTLVLAVAILMVYGFGPLGCSTIKSDSDYDPNVDFARLKTYSWLPDQPRGGTRLLHTNSLRLDRVRNAIDRTLSAKGLQQTDSEKANFLIRSLISEELVPATQAAEGHSNRMNEDPTPKTRRALRYENVAVIIDFLEPRDQALIWRGQAEKRIERNTTAQVREAAIEELVSGILSQYPPPNR